MNGGAPRPLLGLILKMPATATVELAGHAGFDLVLIDTEHGPSDMTELEHHCRAAECAGLDVWVRVSDGASPDILRALDAGARGIVVPHVTSAADVAQAAALTRYPPDGRRSLALSTRAGRYGMRSTDDHLRAAARIALVAQIEDATALAHVDEILAADGLSGIFIGPSDLSASLGHPGAPGHPEVAGAIRRVAQAVLDRPGRALCVLVGDEAEARDELERGAQVVLLNAPALLGGRLSAIVEALAPSTIQDHHPMTETLPDVPILDRLRLDGRRALITGAGQGIGRAFAHALGEAGASVAVIDRDGDRAEAVAAELQAKGITALALACDVTAPGAATAYVEQVIARLGGLEVAVHNAGVNRNSAAEDTPVEEWDEVFALNTRAVFLGCQAAARPMLAQGYGKIVNTASMASLIVPHPQKQAAYNAAKAAVVQLTRTLAAEWADRGVRVNCMSPGIIRTALIERSPDLAPLVAEWLGQIPLGRLGDVSDLQGGIVYLAGGASDYMTGHNLVIEGGQTLW